MCRISTGALSKVITSDKMVLQEVNDLRALKVCFVVYDSFRYSLFKNANEIC